MPRATPHAVYPGTFDPITRGHEDIVRRAVRLFGGVTVAIAESGAKRPFFSLQERVAMARETLDGIEGVAIEGFGSLLVDYMRVRGYNVILRGLRAVSDFEYEFQLAGMNRKLDPAVETLFLTPSDQYMFISASMVREIALLGGEVEPFVHPAVLARIRAKIARQ